MTTAENSKVDRGPISAVLRADHPSFLTSGSSPAPVVLSFDVEEHHRIEAAVGLEVDPGLRGEYRQRMNRVTEWILKLLAERKILATFFIVGQIAETNARLVRTIHEAGHEVASHGWDHRRINLLNPQSFKEDLRMSKEALEQASGAAVLGYRARPSAWFARRHGRWMFSERWDCSTIPRSTRSAMIATGYRMHHGVCSWHKVLGTRSLRFLQRP